MSYLKQRSFVRTAPIIKCEVLANLPYGTEVKLTGLVRDSFSEIYYGIGYGWVHTESLSEIPMRTHDILKTDGHPAMNMLDVANACLSKLPIRLITYLQEQGWSVLITDKDLDLHFYNGQYGGVGGVTDYANRLIYLQDCRWDIENCICHEIGHVIDYLCKFVSDSDEFLSIFGSEKYSFKDSTSVGDGHETSCSREYFASVFSEFWMNPASCMSSAPKSCTFVANFANKFQRNT